MSVAIIIDASVILCATRPPHWCLVCAVSQPWLTDSNKRRSTCSLRTLIIAERGWNHGPLLCKAVNRSYRVSLTIVRSGLPALLTDLSMARDANSQGIGQQSVLVGVIYCSKWRIPLVMHKYTMPVPSYLSLRCKIHHVIPSLALRSESTSSRLTRIYHVSKSWVLKICSG
jgi:hypothetical protein